MNARRPALPMGALLALLLASVALPASAQEMATVQGRVTDPSGAPIASAVVELDRTDGSLRRATVADAAGHYRIAGLPGGEYRIRVRHPGHAPAVRTLQLVRGASAAADVVLALRPLLVDTVTVLAHTPVVIRPEETDFRTEVREEAIRLLPIRPEIREIVALTPGAGPERVWGGATQQANDYRIDGLAANHPGLGGDLLQPSVSWIESVEVRGLGSDAEYGNFQGGMVNVTTKRGTNRFEAALRGGFEGSALAASNLQEHDVAREVRGRYDLEGEVRGPLVRDRLFYYLAGHLTRREEQVVNHLRTRTDFFAPFTVDRSERRGFGKLTWQAGAADQLTLSGVYSDARTENFGATGFEDRGLSRSVAPAGSATAAYRRVLGAGRMLELSASGLSRDQRVEPYADPGVPGVVFFGIDPRPTFHAAPFRERVAPTSLTAAGSLGWELRTGPLQHQLKVGAEYGRGSWLYERVRNGGMTWRPNFGRAYESFRPDDPETWTAGIGMVLLAVGGEVRIDADVRNAAVFLQDQIAIGRRINLNPGVRVGWWEGYLTPGAGVGERFRAVGDRGVDPRLGLTIDLSGINTAVLKAHVGRYHQGMFAQLYDRVEGGNVFDNEQLWFHTGAPDDHRRGLTAAERDDLALAGRLTLFEEVRLNQTGPVEGYRQPYVDQLVVGIERQFSSWIKGELVYVNRTNRNMVGLVDRNLESNHTVFRGVQVFSGQSALEFDERPLHLERLYIPNYIIVEQLKLIAAGYTIPLPPGMSLADTLRLRWDPDYVLTTIPEARRTFEQLQVVLRVAHERFGGAVSVVQTRLRGNLDNVSGYEGGYGAGAGPWVNPNQSVNFLGTLTGGSPAELKVWLYGSLPGGVRAGTFLNVARGDRATPDFTLSTLYQYLDRDGAVIDARMVGAVAGQPMLVETRGRRETPVRSILDLHVERPTRIAGGEWTLEVDAFNVLGMGTPTQYNTNVNGLLPMGTALSAGVEPQARYAAVRERVRPRSVRLGASLRL